MYALPLSLVLEILAELVSLGVGCKATDLDVSPSAFKKLADPNLGRVETTWAWIPPVPST